jgi:hypothetical protein
MNTEINNTTDKPNTTKLFKIAYYCLIFLFTTELINYIMSYLNFLERIPKINVNSIIESKAEFSTNALITGFVTILIAPILEELAFRYSVNGKLNNLYLKIYSFVALMFGFIVVTLPFTKLFDYKKLTNDIFKNYNYLSFLNFRNYTFLVENIIPIAIFLLIALFLIITRFNPTNILIKVNSVINQYPIIFFIITSIIWIRLHFIDTAFKANSWVDILFLLNLIVVCYIFCLYSKLVSIKASIFIHMIHNTFITLASLLFTFDSFKYIYSIFLTLFILVTIILLRKEMIKYKAGNTIEILIKINHPKK